MHTDKWSFIIFFAYLISEIEENEVAKQNKENEVAKQNEVKELVQNLMEELKGTVQTFWLI